MLQPLPRRAPVKAALDEAPAPSSQAAAMPAVSAMAAGRCFMVWLLGFFRISLGEWLDRRLGRDTPVRRLTRLRAVLRRMGPAAVKVAEQLAWRIDLLPRYATALAVLEDDARPMKLDDALARVEEDIGRPPEDIFEIFDPDPIAAGALDCKYQARLLPREGEDAGRVVVVRVRRPGARRAFAVQLEALRWLTSGLERLALLRPGFLDHVRTELTAVISEEMDFRVQARYQSLLRRRLRRERLRRITVPEVRRDLVSSRAMVSEFLSGILLSELLVLLSAEETSHQALLASMDLDPARVARDLLEYTWWCLFENDFFHSGTDPDQIVVTPGGGIGVVEFGHFTTAQGKTRRMVRELFRRMSLGEVTGATEMVVQVLSPLPFIDTHSFSKRLEARLWQQYFAMKDRDAPAAERSSAGLWRAIMEAAGEEGVPIHQELVAMLRAAVAMEELALRLRPELMVLREFRRYTRRAERRKARRFTRRLKRQSGQHPAVALYATADRVVRLADRMTFLSETVAENLPIANLTLPSKASTVISELLTWALRVSSLYVGVSLVWMAWHRASTGEWGAPLVLFRQVLALPPLAVVSTLALLFTLRRCQFRLQDKDPES